MIKRAFVGLALIGAITLAAAVTREEAPKWVRVSTVNVGLSESGPVVFLQARSRAIPIFVDPIVAASIQSALDGPKPPRPLSHDLMQTILLAYDAKVTKASIDLRGDVFFAELAISRDGKETIFDSRSSDAIAMAIRFEAPIFVREDQLDSAGRPLPGTEERML